MANSQQTLPDFAVRLLGLTDDDRKESLGAVHSTYSARKDAWQAQLDSFEGSGGFLDGSYIWPHPKEDQGDYLKRQKMARYHNYVETLVDLYTRQIFTQNVRRTSKDEAYNDWLENVDGSGASINELLKRFASISLVAGHGGLLIDKTPDAPTGPSRADERARVFATVFPATTIADWRFDGNTLSGVKLVESVPDTDIVTPQPTGDAAQRWLIWDQQGWARFSHDGDLIAADVPNLGIVPLVILRPKPSTLSPMIGRALVSNINVIKALFNRASEEDEVLRTQAFSLLTVQVPPDGDVKKAREALGHVVGTSKAIVIQGQIDYKTPDQSVPASIRDNIGYLTQEIYRAAHMRFQRDSLDSESAEAIRLQHSELNEMLQGFSKALSQAEMEIARAWFAWMHPSPEAAQAAFDAAAVEAVYPTEFFLDDLGTELEGWAEAIRLELGDSMTRRIKKQAVRRIDPDIPAEDLAKIDKEIDAMEIVKPTAFPMDTGAFGDVVPPGQAA